MNRIIALLITIFLFGTQNIFSKNYLNYYKSINQAEIAILNNDFEIGDSIYQIAFQFVKKPFKDDYLLAAINSERLNDDQKTYGYLKNGVSNGLTLKRIKKQLSEFKKSSQWISLKNEYDSIRNSYLNSLNLNLRNELMDMVAKDQAVRHPIFGSLKKMNRTDAFNYNRIVEIISENNGKWPGRFTIGDENTGGKYAFGEVTIMLHHFSKEQVLNLKPFLIDAIIIGDLSPYNVAYPLDYTNYKKLGTRGKFIDFCHNIGSFISSNKINITICDCLEAEKKRMEMGLEPLDDYYRKRNSSFDCFENNLKQP